MRIETWDLKEGDYIETYTRNGQKYRKERVKLMEEPFEFHSTLIVRWEKKLSNEKPYAGMSAYMEEPNYWVTQNNVNPLDFRTIIGMKAIG